jgi:lipopolysaccharide transport system ATP-binding protein
VRVKGRVAALLELGSGFNPEFTGRDNVYLNATVLGLTKDEIDARYDAITAFADIGDFIDQPVKTYSSGMTVRLAFAVQSQVDPDILVVDEALAVGDAKFQAKCFERLRQLRESGTSILLVTHSNEQIVTHCNQAMLLNAGKAIEYGEPRQVSNRYMDLLFGKTASDTDGLPTANAVLAEQTPEADALAATRLTLSTRQDIFNTHQGYNPHEYRWGDKRACITDFLLQADGQDYPAFINTNQKLVLTLAVAFIADVFRPIFGFTLKTKEGVTVYGTNSEISKVNHQNDKYKAGDVVFVKFAFDGMLTGGDYFLSLGVASEQKGEIVPHDRRYDSIHIQVKPESSIYGLCNLNGRIEYLKN